MGIKEEKKLQMLRASLRVIQERFKTQINETVISNVRDERIYHGLKNTTSVPMHTTGVTVLCLCPDTKEYLILRNGIEILRYTLQGKPLEPTFPLEPSMTFTRMIWCGKGKRFACFDPEGELLWVFTRDFIIESNTKFDFETRNIHYDDLSNTLVVVGPMQTAKVFLDVDDRADLDREPKKVVTYSDPEFGPTWHLDRSSLVPKTESSPARLIITYHTTMYMVNIESSDDSNKDDDDEGYDFLEKRANAHRGAITAIYFYPTCNWVISGDIYGTVSAWTMKFEQAMTISEVHTDRIIEFYPHPSISGFLSYSEGPNGGNHLQVWSCNFRKNVESFKNLGEIKGVAVNSSAAAVVVLGEKLNYLTMNQTYVFFAPLSTKAKFMSVTTNPMYPSKVVVASIDNSVRLYTPNAKVLNVQILPPDDVTVICAAFSGLKNQLFTIIQRSGEILVSDNTTCPMKFNKVLLNDGPRITCIAIYEFFDEIRDEYRRSRKPRVFCPISVKLVAGTFEGGLVIVNPNTGKNEAQYPDAHGGPVLQLRVNIASKHVVSLGKDRCVKVWRMFADLSKPLVLYYTLNFVESVIHADSMGKLMCTVIARRDQGYLTIMENMESRERLSHHIAKDHKKEIVSMVTSERLEICATSSEDKTIRIWDKENRLRIILDINVCGNPIQFSSADGDIIFSAGRHLYKICHESYLPTNYTAIINANDIYETEELVIPKRDPTYRPYENEVDIEEIIHAYSTIPLGSIDINSENPRVAVLIMQQICALYNSRDEDIKRVKENSVEPKKLSGNRALMVTEDWDNYVNDLLESLKRIPPEAPEYDLKSYYVVNRKKYKSFNERAIFQMRFGYSIDKLEEKEVVDDLISNARLPLHGFLPNSVLYKKRVPVVVREPSIKSVKEVIQIKYKYPPELYPREKEELKRRSLRLSELDMGMGMDMDGDEAND